MANRCLSCNGFTGLAPGLHDGWMCRVCDQKGVCPRCVGAPRPHRAGCIWPPVTLPSFMSHQDRDALELRLTQLMDSLAATTDALEAAIEPWTGAAKQRAEQAIADNRAMMRGFRNEEPVQRTA